MFRGGALQQQDYVAVQDQLQHVRLASGRTSYERTTEFTEFSPNTSSLLRAEAAEDNDEAVMRKCFHEAFEREVSYLRSKNVEVSKDRKRQILADILVWAEITQQHYDRITQRFVLEPNMNDEAFQRVGRFLQEAKQQHSL